MMARAGAEPITYAILGHNEEELLAGALAQAAEAVRPGDSLWFVDGASTDGSAELAASLGVEVVPAPLGKGRAVAAAIERCETPYICLVDSDIEWSSSNIPATLGGELAEARADMLIADFRWGARPFKAMPGVWRPLVGALFPEAAERFGSMPFSGFRLLRTDLALGPLPPGFGVETYLNLLFTVRGLSTRVVHVGDYRGPVRPKPEFGAEVGEAILDVAEAHGRLDPVLRPRWEDWLDGVMEVLRTQPMPGELEGDFYERLTAAAARPLPPAVA